MQLGTDKATPTLPHINLYFTLEALPHSPQIMINKPISVQPDSQ